MKYSPLALESLFKWKCIISLLYFCEVKKKENWLCQVKANFIEEIYAN